MFLFHGEVFSAVKGKGKSMKRFGIVAAVIVVLAGLAAPCTVLGSRFVSWSHEAHTLAVTLSTASEQGVPQTSLAPLSASLSKEEASTKWWSPSLFTSSPTEKLDLLQTKEKEAWNQAMAQGRINAEGVLASWNTYVLQNRGWIPASDLQSAASWPTQLKDATTPHRYLSLEADWNTTLKSAKSAVNSAKASAAKKLAAVGGADGLLTRARTVVSEAQGAGLSTGSLPGLIGDFVAEIEAGGSGDNLTAQIDADIASLSSLIDLNDSVTAALRTTTLTVSQEIGEQTPLGDQDLSELGNLTADLGRASTSPQITSVSTQITALLAAARADLASHRCGHTPGTTGKEIHLTLSVEEMVFYDNGCEVQATPITTGQLYLRTPTGTFHIFDKQTPYQFISPWPMGSPFYYYPSWVNWVMEFDQGGYYIHDAPWEPNGDFGPGSDNGPSASHGCVHTPTPVMQWAFSWTPMGTPVIVVA